MATKKNKKAIVAKLKAQDAKADEAKDFAERIQRAKQSDEYSTTVIEALDATRSWDLISDMEDCGNRHNGNLMECRSLYCAKKGCRKNGAAKSCYKRTTNAQDDLMKKVLQRYNNDDTHLRQNLRSVTILFSVFGFDLDKNDNPVFPMDVSPTGAMSGTVIQAKKKADAKMKALAKKYADVAWLGGYSWEVQHRDKLGGKKSNSLDDLLNHSGNEGLASDCQKIIRSPAEDKWHRHFINFHAHLVVDLRGADGDVFTEHCHKIFGSVGNNKRPVRDGVLVKRMVTEDNKSVPESLATLAQYPFRNQWDYKGDYDGTDDDGHRDEAVNPDETLEPQILSALVNGTTLLHRKINIVLDNKWSDK